MPSNERLEELFQMALECDPGERTHFLAEHCQGDTRLLEELRTLLESDGEAANSGFWSASAVEAEAIRSVQQPGLRTGQTLGPYRVLNVISSGGMGTVYLAARDDAEYQKKVAIKVIRRGMDTDFIVDRFRTERQILAHLEHPNIARLLDGGTTEDGLPYLVMEYIEGQPLDQYSDERKLSISDRLQLFLAVCSAVHYAHQNLVIHRDLKPNNILVTQEGAPKLLDFGVAKLLSPDPSADAGDNTVTGMSFVTPEYASPEQVRGESITTLSDIYSLGVLLYRLLTGHRPYRLKTRSPADIANAICFDEPEKPSTAVTRRASRSSSDDEELTAETVSATREGDPARLRRRLRGDLDNIVLMAIRKEPERRYASAEQFSEDIRRHLDGQPVIAHRGTLAYRAAKFVRRHAVAVAAGGLLVISLLGGIGASTWQAHVARAQRTLAEHRFNDVHKLASSFLFEFHDSIQGIPGTLAARQLVVKRALEYLDSLTHEARDDKSLQQDLSAAYNRVGSLTFDVAMALDTHRKALAINQRLLESEPSNRNHQAQLSLSYGLVANVLKEAGDSPASLENFRKAMTVMESLTLADPNQPEYRVNLAEDYDWMGVMLVRLGQDDSASNYHAKALALRSTLVATDTSNIDYRRALMMSNLYTADRLAGRGDDRTALDYIRSAAQIPEDLNKRDPYNVVYRRDLWLVNLRLARSLHNLHDSAGALEAYQKALTLIEQLSLADPGDQGHRHGLAVTCLEHAQLLGELNRTREAFESDTKALTLSQRLLVADPNKTEARLDLASAYSHLGSLFLKSGSLVKAAESLGLSRRGFEEESRRDPKNVEIQRDEAEVYARLGSLEAKLAAQERTSDGKLERLREARDFCQRSLDVRSGLRQQNPSRKPDRQDEVISVLAESNAAIARLQHPAARTIAKRADSA